MKTDTLKLKALIMALILAGANQASMFAAAPPNPIDQAAQLHAENRFMEEMVGKIKDSVNEIDKLIESFIDKNNPESFSSFIKRCHDRLTLIKDTILDPLERELKAIKATRPDSTYYKILEKTYKLANDMAYKELLTLHTILEKHRTSPDHKKATPLVGALKPLLQKLTSQENLDKLNQKLTEIHQLLVTEKNSAVASEIELLKKLVQEIKVKTNTIQSKVNIELLPIISARLKKL